MGLLKPLPSSNNIIGASFVILSLLCVPFHTEKKKEMAFSSFHWIGKDFAVARARQSATAAAQSTGSTPAPVSVAACRCHAAKQTACPSLCPSSQFWESALGLRTECPCAVQELILHTTSLIPIERSVIPHLQSQISPQSSLLFYYYYSPV